MEVETIDMKTQVTHLRTWENNFLGLPSALPSFPSQKEDAELSLLVQINLQYSFFV